MIEYCNFANFNNVKSIKNNNNIKFLQYNCMKSTNVMHNCLKYATLNKYNIVLLQKL